MKNLTVLFALACTVYSVGNSIFASDDTTPTKKTHPSFLGVREQSPDSDTIPPIEKRRLHNEAQTQDTINLFNQLSQQVTLKIAPGTENEELCKAISTGNVQYFSFVLNWYCKDGPKDFFGNASKHNPMNAIAAMDFKNADKENLLFMLGMIWHHQDNKAKYFDSITDNQYLWNFDYATPLHTAASKGNYAVLDFFISKLKKDRIEPLSEQPIFFPKQDLHTAISTTNVEYFLSVLAQYCDSGPKDFFANTEHDRFMKLIAATDFTDDNKGKLLFMLAMLWHYQDKETECFYRIAEHNSYNCNDLSPLHTAALKGNYVVLDFFLDKFKQNGLNPLTYQLNSDYNVFSNNTGFSDSGCCGSFYQLGINGRGQEFIDWMEKNPLILGPNSNKSKFYLEIIETLLTLKDVHYPVLDHVINHRYLKNSDDCSDEQYDKLAEKFASYGSMKLIEDLIFQKIKITFKGVDNQTLNNRLLAKACSIMREELILFFLEKGSANINYRTSNNNTLLHEFIYALLFNPSCSLKSIMRGFLFHTDNNGIYDLDWDAQNHHGDSVHQVFENIIKYARIHIDPNSSTDNQCAEFTLGTYKIIEEVFNEYHNYVLKTCGTVD